MLIKAKLLQIPPKKCSQKRWKKSKYAAETYFAEHQIEDGIFVVDMYMTTKILIKRFFTDGKNYIIYDVFDEKWNKRICNPYGSPEFECINEKLSEEELEILGISRWYYADKPDRLADALCDFTSRINAEKRRKYEKSRMKKISGMVSEARNITERQKEDFASWLIKDIWPHIAMYEPKGDRTYNKITCTICGHKFRRKKIKHRQELECPHCHEKLTACRAGWNGMTREKGNFAYFNKIDGGFTLMGLEVRREINNEGEHQWDTRQFALHHYKDGKTEELYYANSYYAWWKRAKYPIGDDFTVWPESVTNTFGSKGFKNIDFTKDVKKPFIILNAADDPVVQKMCRFGLTNLAAYEPKKERAKTFHEYTGIDQNYVTMFRKHNYGMPVAESIAKLKSAFKTKGNYNEEQVEKIAALGSFGAVSVEEISKYMTDVKFINYLTKQKELTRRHTDSLISLYIDYRTMARRLVEHNNIVIDMSQSINAFPRNIVEAHDFMSKRAKMLKSKIQNEQLLKRYEEYTNIKIRSKELLIVHPKSKEDFVAEGAAMHHCVGTHPAYMEKQATGKYMTVFIRKKDHPEKSYHTATFDISGQGVRLVCCYAAYNKKATKEVMTFVEKYRKIVEKTLAGEGVKGAA